MEIEGWKSMEPTSLICFNPDCPYEDKRVVNQTATLHLKFEPCRKHMLQAQQLKKHSKEEKEKVMDVLNCNVPLLELNFVKSPVESLKMMFALSQMNWRSTHDNYFRSVKQQLMNYIDELQQQSLEEFSKLIGVAQHYSTLLNIVETPHSEQTFSENLTNELHNLRPVLDDLSKKRLLDQKRLLACVANVKNELVKIKSCLISSDDFVEAKSPVCIVNDRARFQQFLVEDTENQFGKLQILATACGRSAPTYTIKDGRTNLDCFLCEKRFSEAGESSKKLIKKNISLKLINHIRTQHFEEAFQCYRQRIIKSFVREVNHNEVLREIRESNYEEVEIIDRENAGNYECFDERKYVIEVISHKNENLAKGRYLLAMSSSKDAADILMTFLIKDIFNIKPIAIKLVTNDHFGDTLKEVCQSYKYNLVVDKVKKNT